MIDITSVTGGDLRLVDTQVPKAANVLQVSQGSLEYSPEFGINIDFFLDPDFQFQNDSFKSYLIQRLSENRVNVNQVIETLETFFLQFTFAVGQAETSGGFIR